MLNQFAQNMILQQRIKNNELNKYLIMQLIFYVKMIKIFHNLKQ
jgi:hypothetical protein